MKSFSYQVGDPIGLHARPAGLLVREAKGFASKITLAAKGKCVDASKLIALMQLGVGQGTVVVVSAEGPDEETAIVRLEEFFKANL